MKFISKLFLAFLFASVYSCADKSVPLPDIGCGSRIKPFFLETAKEGMIKESWSNRQGTIIAIVWADGFTNSKQREDLIQPLFKKNNIDASLINEEQKISDLAIGLKNDKWYKGMDIDQLSLEEAGVIANEMVTFAISKGFIKGQQADSIKKEIENYFKAELVKVRTLIELVSEETREKWRTDVGELVSKYIGKEKTDILSQGYADYREQKEETQESCCEKPGNSSISEVTCPDCGHKKIVTLPTDVCVLEYTCQNCSAILHPKDGDCCVYCSYGDHKCPSKQ